MHKQARERIGTGTLNRVLREAVDAHPPAMHGTRTPRIYYATQVSTAPPTIVLFVNHTSLFEPTYQRYLLNVFHEKLPFHDIPIKLYLRARTQSETSGTAQPPDLTADQGSRVDPGARVDRPQETAASGPMPDDSVDRPIDRELNELLSELDN